MEESKVQERVINLGRLIVKELELDPGVDTLAKWMAHYVAEKIESAGKLSGKRKSQAEEECFMTILKLWQHRWAVPYGKPFFHDFESLFETLEKLNPIKETPFFLPPKMIFDMEDKINSSETDQNDNRSENIKDKMPNSKIFFEAALEIDRLARALIFDLLNQAVIHLDLTPEREKLIRTSIGAIDYPESRILRIVSDHYSSLEIHEEEQDEKQKRILKVKSRIADFDDLISSIVSLKKIYNEELIQLENISK